VRGLVGKQHPGGDLEAEIRAHLDLLTGENIRKGMAPEEAR